jgi:hypothetical protein
MNNIQKTLLIVSLLLAGSAATYADSMDIASFDTDGKITSDEFSTFLEAHKKKAH